MDSRVSFSGEQEELFRLSQRHDDLEAAIRLYFSNHSPSFSARFSGYTTLQVSQEMQGRLDEFDLMMALAVLAALEAAFRIDYLQRCYKKKKDPLSKNFRDLYKKKGARANFEDDILSAWKEHSTISNQAIQDLKSVFKFRHWLAHGRYWTPKLGREYDYATVFELAQAVLTGFSLEAA